MDSLPEDVFVYSTMPYLSIHDLSILTRVSKGWKRLIEKQEILVTIWMNYLVKKKRIREVQIDVDTMWKEEESIGMGNAYRRMQLGCKRKRQIEKLEILNERLLEYRQSWFE